MIEFAVVTSSSALSESDPTAGAKASASLSSIGLVFLCTLSGAAAQLLMKHGANHLHGAGLIGVVTNLPLISGYLLYGVNTVLMVLALRHGHLSVLYPIIALTYVWVTILSPIVFPEDHLNPFKIAGVAIIVLGVSLIGIGSRE